MESSQKIEDRNLFVGYLVLAMIFYSIDGAILYSLGGFVGLLFLIDGILLGGVIGTLMLLKNKNEQ